MDSGYSKAVIKKCKTMSYIISSYAQQSEEWFNERKKKWLTMSNLGAALGYSKFSTVEQLIRDTLSNKKFEPNEAMILGTLTEPIARTWYEENYQVSVQEVGLATPTWEPRIGGSPDGLVGEDGMIEIKCPKHMYSQLKNEGRIYDTHYFQMQGCLMILERNWCDYVVYAIEDREVIVKRVFRDDKLIQDLIKPGVQKFLTLFEREMLLIS